MSWDDERGNVEHQVLTVETEKPMSWRVIECAIAHYPTSNGTCINGVLYYKPNPNKSAIICFDNRSETYSFVRTMESSVSSDKSTLINYKGKLGALLPEECGRITEAMRRFEMWVLEDPEKHEWSKQIYELPCE
ncbi:unnamed protein product [Microthlaspi erraticum]|uniref:F-box associated beta-propeller type 3 domain-containing protein n=1 Tax=Microthlaspi erraticum TaxID=1685480 RepID=A0A6D2HDY5_9BRAS|nr:unnamed protein product [Microthlaspi erraticum]